MTRAALNRFLAGLRRDSRGVSVIEFAFVAPILLMLTLGTLQFAIDVYGNAVLKGAVQEAGRNSGLESAAGDQTAVDNRVKSQLRGILPGATTIITRKNYAAFDDVGRPEDFDDTNNNDVYDGNECFTDENANGNWDGDVGANGQGGARDVALYTVEVSYKNVVPIGWLLGLSDNRKLTASTTLMNQPFATQRTRSTKHICP